MDVVERALERSFALGTRGWLLIGLIACGLAFGVFGASLDGDGWSTDTFSDWVVVVAPVVAAR